MKHISQLPAPRIASVIALACLVFLAACSEQPPQTPQPPVPALAEDSSQALAIDTDCASSPLPVQSQQTYQDADGMWWVFGQVQNSTYQDVSLARLCIQFEQNGKPQIREWLLDTSMHSGEVVPFRAVLQDIPANATLRVSAQVDERVNGPAISYREFSQSGTTVTPQHGDKLQFGGTIRNTGDKAAGDIRIVISIYDDGNHLIGVANGRVSLLGALNPGEETIFTANASRLFGNMARYEILVEGDVMDEALDNE